MVEKMKKEVFGRLSIEEQNRLACTDNENAPVIMFRIPAKNFPKVRGRVRDGYSDKQVLDVYHMLRKFCKGDAAEALRDSIKKFNILVSFPRESWKDVWVLFSTLETELEGIQPIILQRNGTFDVALIDEEIGSVSGETCYSVKRLGLQEIPV